MVAITHIGIPAMPIHGVRGENLTRRAETIDLPHAK